ncbi:MAG TPA: energy transducer TonB [Gemmatimonadales bacterium]|nr:energy transducer TonB [Gemmatimonadales bacterium]
MFLRLIESRPRSGGRWHSGGGFAAVVGHAALVAGAVLGTLRPADPSRAIPAVLMPWPQPPERRVPGLPPVPLPGDAVLAPVDVPPDLPPIDAVRPLNSPPGVPASPDLVGGTPSTPDDDGPWASAVVEEPPVLLAGRAPSYPELLRVAGIAGRVVVEAVIDTLGRAEATVRVVESSHAGFEGPALDYVRRAMFRPGRAHGRPVRVLVRLPVDFRLSDAH